MKYTTCKFCTCVCVKILQRVKKLYNLNVFSMLQFLLAEVPKCNSKEWILSTGLDTNENSLDVCIISHFTRRY